MLVYLACFHFILPCHAGNGLWIRHCKGHAFAMMLLKAGLSPAAHICWLMLLHSSECWSKVQSSVWQWWVSPCSEKLSLALLSQLFSGCLWHPRDWKWILEHYPTTGKFGYCRRKMAFPLSLFETSLVSWKVCFLSVFTIMVFHHKSNRTHLETPPARFAAVFCSNRGSMMSCFTSEDNFSVTISWVCWAPVAQRDILFGTQGWCLP